MINEFQEFFDGNIPNIPFADLNDWANDNKVFRPVFHYTAAPLVSFLKKGVWYNTWATDSCKHTATGALSLGIKRQPNKIIVISNRPTAFDWTPSGHLLSNVSLDRRFVKAISDL